MTSKITISIDEELLEYLDRKTDNRSKFISDLVRSQAQKDFSAELEAAYIDQEKDPEFQEEIKLWDSVSGDGIEEELSADTGSAACKQNA